MRRVVAATLVGWVLGAPIATWAQPAETTTTASAATALSPAEARRARENAEVIRLAKEAEGDFSLPTADGEDGGGLSLAGVLLRMVVVLGAVSLLAYLVLGKLLPKLMRVPSPTGRPRMMRVVDRLPIDQRRSLLLVAIGEEYFLVGAAESGIHLISRLDADAVRRAEVGLGAEKSSLGRFAEALSGRASKEH